MRRFLALLAAGGLLLLAGPARAASVALPGPGGPVEVEAGSVTYDAATERFELAGAVRVRRGEVLLRAAAGTYDPRTGTLDATGDVLLTAPGRVVAAEAVHVVLDGAWDASKVSAYYKEKPLDLGADATLEAARRDGRNRVSVCAARVEGTTPSGAGASRFSGDDVRLTLCDCGDGAPSWEIRAQHAEVEPGNKAVLTWPVLYVTPRFLFIDEPIPVLPLPWLQVPLSGRQTGFLFPVINVGSRGGFWLAQPFFFTLGESFDLTVTPGYAFGPSSASVASAEANGEDPGFRGFGTGLEFRWAPAPGVRGELRLNLQHDTLPYAWKPYPWRLGLALRSEARLAPATFLNVDANLFNDAAWPQDFVGDLLVRNALYYRSGAVLGQVFPDALLELDAAYHLAIGTLGTGAPPGQPAPPVVPFGLFGGSVPSFHRLPALTATLLPVPVVGPLRLSGQAGIARFAPITGITDRSVNGLGPGDRWWYGPPPPPGDTWTAGQRLSATRAWTRAELRAPFDLGQVVELEPWVAGTATGYAFGASAQPALANAWAVGGLMASTRIGRTFGEGADRLRHEIEPVVEWRGGTGVAGPGLPAYAYDESDAAPVLPGAPCTNPWPGMTGGCLPLRSYSATIPGGFQQLRLVLRNRVVAPAGPLSVTRLELDLGQDLDLQAGKLGETWFRGAAAWGPVKGSLLGRFLLGGGPPPGTWAPETRNWLDAFTELRLDVSAEDRRGDRIYAGLMALSASPSASLRAGLDPLFDPRPVPFQPFGQGSAGLKVHVLGGLDLQWDTLFSVRTVYATPCGGGAPAAQGPSMQQNTVSATWNSPCNCWRGVVRVQVSQCGYFGVSAGLDLAEVTGLNLVP